jgi:nucleotide-binding universal stress UspA family protein
MTIAAIIEIDPGYPPILLVSDDAVRLDRELVRYLLGSYVVDSPDFQEHNPVNPDTATEGELEDWLADLHEATTNPWVTYLHLDIEVGDRVLTGY